MKYLPLFIFVLFGCSNDIKQGHCYFNSRYSKAIKVTKVAQYGFFAEEIERPAVVNMYCGYSDLKPNIYLAWDTVDDGFGDGFRLKEVDCEAYEDIKKGKSK